MIKLQVRRFFCIADGCGAVTFAEQIPGLTSPHARRTPLVRSQLESIGIALAGRAGARLARCLGVGTSRSTLLRMVRALPDPPTGIVSVLGVDDFAFRRGRVYGTVLMNLDTNTPIDLLPDSQSDTFAAWLRDHPGVQVICRDRAGSYAEAARTAAPDAIQVADRWHLWNNLAGYVEKTVGRNKASLSMPDRDSEATDDRPAVVSPRPAEPTSKIVARAIARHAAVHAELRRGRSVSAISRSLGLDRKTVRKFARAAAPDDVVTRAGKRGSKLDPFGAYLNNRWAEGCENAAVLTEEVKAQGFRGSDKTVRRYLQPLRGTTTPPPPRPPSVREVTRWILTHPDHLDSNDKTKLDTILTRSTPLRTTAARVAEFATMMTGLHGHRLHAWMAAINTDDNLPDLKSFTAGIRRDLQAVLNGLTLPHNSGAVEGTVNKLKYIKRQMFGRAKLDLLRKRVLLA